MKQILLSVALLAFTGFSFAQNGKSPWKKTDLKSSVTIFENRTPLPTKNLFELDITSLKNELSNIVDVAKEIYNTIKSSSNFQAFYH